jgi:hypothetical protein
LQTVKRKSEKEADFQKEIENFYKEIAINWGVPHHKNLVAIVGTAELFSLPYMVMESCDTSLQQYLLDYLKVRGLEASEPLLYHMEHKESGPRRTAYVLCCASGPRLTRAIRSATLRRGPDSLRFYGATF